MFKINSDAPAAASYHNIIVLIARPALDVADHTVANPLCSRRNLRYPPPYLKFKNNVNKTPLPNIP